jgi:hypothetical protein
VLSGPACIRSTRIDAAATLAASAAPNTARVAVAAPPGRAAGIATACPASSGSIARAFATRVATSSRPSAATDSGS